MSKEPPLLKPAEIARRVYTQFAAILHTDAGIDELTWDQLQDSEREAFVEAVDIVLAGQITDLADWAQQEIEKRERATPARDVPEDVAARFDVSDEEADPAVCYVCGKYKALPGKLTCQRCL